MAYSVPTSLTTLAKLGKKVQGNVLTGFQKKCPEWALARSLKPFNLVMSQREVTTPIDIVRQPSGSFIPEGGYESLPRTEAPNELTFTWANFNDRIGFTKTSEYLDKTQREGELLRQAIYQTNKLIEAMTRRVSFSFYGVSTGVMCLTSTNATSASQTLTLIDGFAASWLDNAAYLASMFQVDDYIAVIRSAALVTNGIGIITAVTAATPSIAVTMSGSCDVDANDSIVLANSSGHELITGTIAHTDYNKAPSGLFDFLYTASVENLSNATAPLWYPSGYDSAGGALTGVRIMAADHAISNIGGGDANLLILSQGVYRNLYQNAYAGVKYNDPLNMEIVGAVKTNGFKQFMSRFVPPTFACLCEKETFINKWTMVEFPSEDAKTLDGVNVNTDKQQDINASVTSFDFPYNFVTTNRANSYSWSGLDES
jgi:hypothetical protein